VVVVIDFLEAEAGGLGTDAVWVWVWVWAGSSSNLGPPGDGGEAFLSLLSDAKLYLGLYDPEATIGSSWM